METSAMDKKVDLRMFLNALGGKITKLMASTLTDDEKLQGIIKVATEKVQQKRIAAREIGIQMKAIQDSETEELEPLEAKEKQRAQLINLATTLVNDPSKAAQLGQVEQSIAGLDSLINADKVTYAMLKDSYEVAKANYQKDFLALETLRKNGPATLKAIGAYRNAVKTKDQTRAEDAIDVSFLNDLGADLNNAKAALRSDKELDDDIDPTKSFNVDAELAKMDATSVNEKIRAEILAAAAAKK
jgi:hypothetical protein